MAVEFKAGLKDVVAVNSGISTVDGDAGRLTYRGYDIRDLATQSTYGEVVYLIWKGELPSQSQLTPFARRSASPRRSRSWLPTGTTSVRDALRCRRRRPA
ncbi:MAG: citrate/2-methylcitrate synthase [Armatimonadetes bacterium]|nr:citrate/2-methylcitrate synthase [Armatimonadota bacterium]